MPFPKGISGNPNGRPRDSLGILIRAKAGLPEKILKIVLKCADSSNEKIQMQACEFLAERGWGKPAQQIEVEGKNLVISFSDDNAKNKS